jgi:hypothetical protein
MLKWEKAAAELISKWRYRDIGLEPTVEGVVLWGWGNLDPETGKCFYTKEHLKIPGEALITAHKEVREGKFHSER